MIYTTKQAVYDIGAVMVIAAITMVVIATFLVLCYLAYADNMPHWLLWPFPPAVVLFVVGGVLLALGDSKS